jgi:hypothetical protein
MTRRLTLVGLRVDDVQPFPLEQRKGCETIIPPAPERDTWPSLPAPYTDLPDGAMLEGHQHAPPDDPVIEPPSAWTAANAIAAAAACCLIAVVFGVWAWLLASALEWL